MCTGPKQGLWLLKEFTNEAGSSQASKQASKEEKDTKNRLDVRLASDRARAA